VRWEGDIACIGEKRNFCNVVVGKREGRDHLEDLGIDGNIILEFMV